MRSVPSRPALVAAAAAVLLTACGGADGSGDEEAAGVTSAATSSPAAPSTGSPGAGPSASDDPAVVAFCEQAAGYQALGDQLVAATPEQLPGLLQQAADAVQSVQAPPQITGDWGVFGDAVRAFADTAGSVDGTTPDGQAQLSAAAEQFLTVAQGPEATNVTQFTQQNCGVAAPPS